MEGVTPKVNPKGILRERGGYTSKNLLRGLDKGEMYHIGAAGGKNLTELYFWLKNVWISIFLKTRFYFCQASGGQGYP